MSHRWTRLHLDLDTFRREEAACEGKDGGDDISLPRIARAGGKNRRKGVARPSFDDVKQSASKSEVPSPTETENSTSLLSRINALHAVLPQSLLLRRLEYHEGVRSLVEEQSDATVPLAFPGRPPPRSRSKVLPYSENLPSSFVVPPLMLSSLEAARGGRWGIGVGCAAPGMPLAATLGGGTGGAIATVTTTAPSPCTTDFRLSLESHYAASKIQNLWRRYFTKWRVWGPGGVLHQKRATTIQAHWRGIKTRRKFRTFRAQ